MSVETEAKEVVLEYFSVFRDERGVSSESVTTQCRTLGELYKELAEAFGLRYDPESVRVARNDEFSSWDTPVENGDRVVFLAPFGGG